MTIPAPNLDAVWQIRLGWETDTISFLNVIACRASTTPGSAQDVLDSVEASLDAAFSSTAGQDYLNLIDTDVRLATIQVTRYDAGSPDTAEISLPAAAPWLGDGTGFRLPPQCSVVVTLRTGLASRRYRGRIYTGGYVQGVTNDEGRLTTQNQGFIQTFWREVQTQLAGGTIPMILGVLSRGWVNEGAEDPRESYAQAFVDAQPVVVRDLLIDTQRSRVA